MFKKGKATFRGQNFCSVYGEENVVYISFCCFVRDIGLAGQEDGAQSEDEVVSLRGKSICVWILPSPAASWASLDQ